LSIVDAVAASLTIFRQVLRLLRTEPAERKSIDSLSLHHQRNLNPNCVSRAGNALPMVPNAVPDPENWFGA
jgi:hypothetical protein